MTTMTELQAAEHVWRIKIAVCVGAALAALVVGLLA